MNKPKQKDKKQIIGEEMTDKQIKYFLSVPDNEENAEIFLLQRAYKSLREQDFERFMVFFKEAGFDKNQMLNGFNFAQLLKDHKKSEKYVQIWESA